MKLIIVTSPVGAFDVAVLNDKEPVESRSLFLCDLIEYIASLTSKYDIEICRVLGQKNYTKEIIEELQEHFSFSISD